MPSGPTPSIGRPRPSSARPSSSSPTSTRELAAPWRSRARPGRCPSASPSGISSVRPSRKPTTSAGTGGAAAARVDRADLADLGLEAGRLDDQADQVLDPPVAAVQVGVAERGGGGVERADHDARRASSTTSRARLSLVSTRASTSPSGVRTTAPPRDTRRSAWTSQCSMPPSVRAQVVHRLAHGLEVGGVHQHGHPLALDDAAQRAAHRLDDQRGLDGDRAADHLLGQEQREVDGVRLEALGGGQLLALQRRRARSASPRARAELGQRRRAALLVALGRARRSRIASASARGARTAGRRPPPTRLQAQAGRRLEPLEGELGGHATSARLRRRSRAR